MGERIMCRTTVNLPGAPVGSRVLVDPEDAEIKVLLSRDLIVPDEDAPKAPLSRPESPPDGIAAVTEAFPPPPTPPPDTEAPETAPPDPEA